MNNDHLQQPIMDDIKHIIAAEIVSGCAQQFITADFVPPCIKTLQNDEMRHGLMGILVGQHYDTILQIADDTARENIPLIEKALVARTIIHSNPSHDRSGYRTIPASTAS